MNLSLFLLFAPLEESSADRRAKPAVKRNSTSSRHSSNRRSQPGLIRLPVQASRLNNAMRQPQPGSLAKIGFGLSIFSNAVGFVVMTGGILLLLSAAETFLP